MSDDIALVLIKRIEALEEQVAELKKAQPAPAPLHQLSNPAWYFNPSAIQGGPFRKKGAPNDQG